MHRNAPITFAIVAIFGDWLAVVFALTAAYALRFESGLLAAPQGIPGYAVYFPGILAAACGWTAIFAFLGLYEIRRGLNRTDEALLVLKGAFLGTLVTMSAGFLYRDVSFSRLFLLIAVPITYTSVLTIRMALRRGRTLARRRGFGVQRIVLAGGGPVAEEVLDRIHRRPDFGYEVVGMLAVPGVKLPEGEKVLGDVTEAPHLCREHRIDRVFIALPEEQNHLTTEIVASCGSLPLDFEIVPDLFHRIGERMRVTEMDGIPLLGVKGFPLESWNRFVKRTFDIGVSGLLMVLFAPIVLIIAFAIAVNSRGPVLYSQLRIGRDGTVFRIFKFRTMPVGVESGTGPVMSKEGDRRATRVGRFLRRTSLDELPQLVNVLAGHMSLVGPRPERPHFVEQFEREIPRYFDRHRVKSGMTGWAQVNGLRGDTSIEERTRYDVFYVENWSLFFDVKILLLTFQHVYRHAIRS